MDMLQIKIKNKQARTFKVVSKRYRGRKIALAPFDRKDYQTSPEAGIAQLVEHLICNQGVAGSNPAAGTRHKKLLTWHAPPTVFAVHEHRPEAFLTYTPPAL